MVVGGSHTPASGLHPFLWDQGVMEDLGTLGGSPVSFAYAINDSSQVVGTSFDPFLWSPESGMQDLGSLGGKGGTASAINAEGDVIGWSPVLPGGVNRAFLWQDGNMRDLGDLSGGNSASIAIGINNLGQVVGQSGINGGAPHAFLWTDSDGMIDLGSLDGNPDSTSEADAINDQGQIIGSSYSFDFNST